MSTAEKNVKFAWKGISKQGMRVSGELMAANIAEVEAKLLQQGVKSTTVHQKVEFFSFLPSIFKAKVNADDVLLFCRQLSTMISANTPLLQSLDIIIEGEQKESLQQLLSEVRNDVAAGIPLSEALRKHKKYFDSLFCNLVAIGEQSGTLDTLLEKIAEYKEKMDNIRKKIVKAMFYPVFIIVFALIVVFIMLIFVVPHFEKLFHGFGKQLPAFTRAVITASRVLQTYWWAFIICITAAIFGFMYLKRHVQSFGYFVDGLKLKIFIFGPILKKAIIARVTRTLSIALAAGVPLVDALNSIAGIAGNKVYRNAIISMRDAVAAGQSLDLSVQATNLFPNLVVKLIVVGEQSGELEAVLDKVSTFYERDVEHAIGILSSLIEPIVIIVLGVIIGVFVASMYLPLFKLGSLF